MLKLILKSFLTAFSGNRYPLVWTSPAVKELFEGKSSTPSNTTSTNTLSPSSSTIPASRSQHLSHSTMAGIALGCIAFIIVSVVIAAIFTKKRNSKRIRAIEPSSRSPQTFPSEPQLIELSAEQRAQEILTVRQDCTELPHTSRVIVGELSSGAPELPG